MARDWARLSEFLTRPRAGGVHSEIVDNFSYRRSVVPSQEWVPAFAGTRKRRLFK